MDVASSVREALNELREVAGVELQTYKTTAFMEKATDDSLLRYYVFDFDKRSMYLGLSSNPAKSGSFPG